MAHQIKIAHRLRCAVFYILVLSYDTSSKSEFYKYDDVNFTMIFRLRKHCVKKDMQTKCGKIYYISHAFMGGVHKFELVFLEITTKIM